MTHFASRLNLRLASFCVIFQMLAFLAVLLLAGPSAGSSIPSNSGHCPVVFKKPDSECVGAVSECWSIGQVEILIKLDFGRKTFGQMYTLEF
jgi:hypothetical protein